MLSSPVEPIEYLSLYPLCEASTRRAMLALVPQGGALSIANS